jgi:gamma-glutamylcyclotransferase (GGCT)/AIG2-like uncharacterized protein YtfP
MTDPELIFVYGSLMQGCSLHHLLQGRASFVGNATVRGRLVSLGDYPGLLEDAGGLVRGEVYRAERHEALWRLLDEAEGYNPRNEAESLFVRETIEAVMGDGSSVIVWVYRYSGSLFGAAPIPSGDYRQHRVSVRP